MLIRRAGAAKETLLSWSYREDQRREAARAPGPEGPSLRSLVLASWAVGADLCGPGPAGAPRAPLWRSSMRSARRFHTLWVMPLSFRPPGRGEQERSYYARFTGEETEAGEEKGLAKISPN